MYLTKVIRLRIFAKCNCNQHTVHVLSVTSNLRRVTRQLSSIYLPGRRETHRQRRAFVEPRRRGGAARSRSPQMPFVDLICARSVAGKTVSTPAKGRRAAVAAIFRTSEDGEEQVLFIRRAANEADPWSGDVALPGGKQEIADGGDDEVTAIRETREEVGIDLSDGSRWEKLGRLVDDRVIKPRGKSVVVSMHGFAAKPSKSEPRLRLNAREVAEAWWVETRGLRATRLVWRLVPLSRMLPGLRRRPWSGPVLRGLGIERVRFAALNLPPPSSAQASDVSTYQLWGLTLSLFSDLLRATRLSKPLIGAGAPPEFRSNFGPEGRGYVAAYTFQVLELARRRGPRYVAALLAVTSMGALTIIAAILARLLR